VRWLDLPHFFTIAIFVTMLIAAIQPVTDPDFWWHVTTGNWILSHHAVPRTDLFTYTVSGHRWITHEWLSEVLLSTLYAVGRLPLESFALGAITAAGFFLVYRAIDRRVNFVIAGLALALGVAAANPIWGPRIQMVTFALTALTYLWVKRFCEGHGRALYFLPAVMLVWVNLHAGFVVAYAVVGTALLLEGLRYLARRPGAMPIDRLKAMGIVLLAAVAVAIVNPNGWDIYLYPFQTGGSPEQQRLIVEWFSPNFQMSQIWPFEAMVFLIIGGLALARRIELRQFLLLLLGLGLALHSVRNLSFFMLVAVPALADYAQQARERLPWHWPRRLPRTSIATFAANVLIYRLYGHTPAQPVFIFGDAALDGDQLLHDYSHLQSLGSDQPQLLARYQINWVIFHSDDPIITELRQDHNAPGHVGWFELGSFDKATIMLRDTPENRAYAAGSGR